MKFNLSFWKKVTPNRKRLYSIILVFIVALVVTIVGSVTPLSQQDATNISQNLNSTLQLHRETNTLTQYIFLNNFGICLLMFIPIVGAGLGVFILFNTGLALGAIASTQGYPVWVGLGSLVLTPVFWLEFAAYSLAMAESVWIFVRIIRLRLKVEPDGAVRWTGISTLKNELKWLGISITACAGLLVIGAFVEVFIISLAG
jgi:uncharacterized membrane protein SpoIIM required for sporulation